MRRLFLALHIALTALILLNPWTSWGAVYYVDCGADPGGDGSLATPWDTVADVNGATFEAGDNVLFNRGCTWREQLTVPSSGSAGNVITFGAYGSGAAPIIAGSKLASVSGDWTQESGATINFQSDFEENNFDEWTTVSNTNGNFSVSTDQKHDGSYSMKVVQVSGNDGTLLKTGIGDSSNATFYVWVYFSTTTDPDATIYLKNSATDDAAKFDLRYSAGAFKTTATAFNDAGTPSATAAYTITANTGEWHKITIAITTSATVGGIELLIDDVSKETITDLDNSDRGKLDRVWWTNYSGSYFFDGFTVTSGTGDTNLWYTAAPVTPNAAWRNGTRMTKVTNKVDIGTDVGDWWHDDPNDRVYVYGGGSYPSGNYDIAQRSYAIAATDKGYVTVDNVSLKYTNSDLIRLTRSAATLTNWTISNSTLTGAYGRLVGTVGSAENQFSNFTFHHNTGSDWGGNVSANIDGIALYYGSAFDFHNNTLTLSPYPNNNYGGVIHVALTDNTDTGSKIYSNTINGSADDASNNTAGIQMERTFYTDVYQNDISGNIAFGVWTDVVGTPDVWDGSFYCNFYRNHIHTAGAVVGRGIKIESTYMDNIYYNLIDLSGALNTSGGIWGIWVGIGNGADGSGGDAHSNIYNNTIIVPAGGAALQLGWSSYTEYLEYMTVKNNILYHDGVDGAAIIVQKLNGGLANNGHVLDYNIYHDEGTANYVIGWFGATYSTAAALHAAQATQETNGLTADPLFTSTVTPDFSLQAGSPAINAGVDVGLTTDYRGMVVPQGSAPDIGAYEFGPGDPGFLKGSYRGTMGIHWMW